MKKSIEIINQNIELNQNKVNKLYKPVLHFTAPIGWINDPNGFSFDGINYHLFYQYHPFSSKWGPMHWGHAISKDLIQWNQLPIALAPSEDYDQSGIFSGTALWENGKIRLYYTGHVDIDGKVDQTQCIAESSDGINFEKYAKNPILDLNSMPNDSLFADFRDPKIIKYPDEFILLMGSRTQDYRGQILMYSSKDGYHFEYKNRIVFPRNYGDVIECPDLFHLDGFDVLIFSTQKAVLEKGVQNSFSVFAQIGQFNQSTYTFDVLNEQILDYGFDFYAPQSTQTPSETSLIAWMNSWERTQVTDELGHQWAGSMTIPRILSIKNNTLIQSFPKSLLNHFSKHEFWDQLKINSNSKHNFESTPVSYFEFSIKLNPEDNISIRFFNDDHSYLECFIDGNHKELILDRSHSKYSIHSKVHENEAIRRMKIPSDLKVSILTDRSSIEIIVNGISMTSLFYGEESAKNIIVTSTQTITLIDVSIYEK